MAKQCKQYAKNLTYKNKGKKTINQKNAQKGVNRKN